MGLVSRHSEHLRTLMVLSLQHFSATSTSSCYSQMETRAMKALIFPFHFIRSPNSLLKHTCALKGVLLLTPSFAVPQSDGSVCKTASDQCKLQPMSSASTLMPPEQILQLPLPSLSCSANPPSTGIPITHLGLMQVHSVHPSVVRALGDKQCDRRLLRGLHGGQAVSNPFPPATHTP